MNGLLEAIEEVLRLDAGDRERDELGVVLTMRTRINVGAIAGALLELPSVVDVDLYCDESGVGVVVLPEASAPITVRVRQLVQ